jgi:hypothetical protein
MTQSRSNFDHVTTVVSTLSRHAQKAVSVILNFLLTFVISFKKYTLFLNTILHNTSNNVYKYREDIQTTKHLALLT